MRTQHVRHVFLIGLISGVLMLPNVAARAAELLMFESPLCEWCDMWHEEIGPIYPKTAEARCAPLRRLDISDPLPQSVTDIRPVIYTPTFVLVEDGREVGRIMGYPGEDFFWGLLAEMFADLRTPCIG